MTQKVGITSGYEFCDKFLFCSPSKKFIESLLKCKCKVDQLCCLPSLHSFYLELSTKNLNCESKLTNLKIVFNGNLKHNQCYITQIETLKVVS